MKFCKDCKYSKIIPTYPGSVNMDFKCTHVHNLELAYGAPARLCEYIREDGAVRSLLNGTCGKRGRFWESKK